jgi:hypothetical protein
MRMEVVSCIVYSIEGFWFAYISDFIVDQIAIVLDCQFGVIVHVELYLHSRLLDLFDFLLIVEFSKVFMFQYLFN